MNILNFATAVRDLEFAANEKILLASISKHISIGDATPPVHAWVNITSQSEFDLKYLNEDKSSDVLENKHTTYYCTLYVTNEPSMGFTIEYYRLDIQAASREELVGMFPSVLDNLSLHLNI